MPSEKRKVLIVDDEPEIVEILATVVQDSLGYDVVRAGDGQEALDLYRANPSICCVVSDIKMPEKEGLEFLRDLRALKYWGSFAFLTGYGDEEKMLAAIQLGASDFISKPFNIGVLEDTLARLVETGWQLKLLNESSDAGVQQRLNTIHGLTLLNHRNRSRS